MAPTNQTRHLFGIDLIYQQTDSENRYLLADGLGSVRTEIAASIVDTVTTFEPYGNLLVQTGSSGTVYGFTGEQFDDAVDLLYLRARFYNPWLKVFMSRDPYPGQPRLPSTMHGYSYVYNSPTNLTDPTGFDAWWCDYQIYPGVPSYAVKDAINSCRQEYYATLMGNQNYCPVPAPGTPGGEWDCATINVIRDLRQAFLNSASRHNKIPGMDNNAFAALIASVVVSEGKIGGTATRPSWQLIAESFAAWCGIITSGHDLQKAFENKDWDRFFNYVTNRDVTNLATIGVGNISLDTATDLWNSQACGHYRYAPECTSVEVSTLKTTNAFGIEIHLPNPYNGYSCGAMGTCVSFERSEQGAYEYLAPNLLDDDVNIEYIAANLEAGALRAISKGMTPGAFNSATWHMFGVQERSIIESRFLPGPFGPMGIVKNIPTALDVLGLTSGWQLEADKEYVYWRGQGY